jgi:starvation-inducible DNA-binding protein
LLGKSLVTAIDTQRYAKQAQWNVQGPNFIALHLLFDEVHGVAIEWADLCAERLVALGGTADGRIQNVAEKTELTPYPLETKDGADHVRPLASALASLGHEVREAIGSSAEASDPTTSDLFTQISSERGFHSRLSRHLLAEACHRYLRPLERRRQVHRPDRVV